MNDISKTLNSERSLKTNWISCTTPCNIMVMHFAEVLEGWHHPPEGVIPCCFSVTLSLFLFLIDMLFPDLNISPWLCTSAFLCSARLPQRLLLLVLRFPLYLPWFFKTIRFCSTSSLWSSFSVWQSLKFWSYLWVAHPISLHLICDKLLNEDQYAFSPAAPTFCSPPSLQN